MAFLSMIVAWLGAVIWFGGLSVHTLITSDESAAKHGADTEEYGRAQRTAVWQLHQLRGVGTGAVICGTMGVVITQKAVTPLQAIASCSAALALLTLVFHVEHYHRLHERHTASRLLANAHLLASLGVVIIATMPLLPPFANPATILVRGDIVVASGLLIGMLIASIALVPLLRALPSPQREELLASTGVRWTLGMGWRAALLAIGGSGATQLLWSTNHLVAMIIVVGLAAPFIVMMRVWIIITLCLADSLSAMPIIGRPERSLRTRTSHIQATAQYVWRVASANALITMVIAAAAITYIIVPEQASPPPRRLTPLAVVSASPTATPIAAQGKLLLAQQAGGITVTISSDPLSIGTNMLHVMVADAHGQAIPDASVIVVVSPPSRAAGQTLEASPDAANSPPDFVAMIAITQVGVWHIVILVATADQSASARVSFAIRIVSKV